MIDPSRQLKPAPLSFEKTFSQHARVRIHVHTDRNGKPIREALTGNVVPRLNRKGQRKAEALARRSERRAFRRAKREA